MTDAQPKPLLILDLDETLVHATASPLHRAPDFRVGQYAVYRRPFLRDFLNATAEFCELAIWSASTADYLHAIVSQILPEGLQLQFVWSRARCTQRYHSEWQDYYHIKDLKKVKRRGFDLSRVLIVDDTPRKLERNYGNAIYVRPFEGDPSDGELHQLLPYLVWLSIEPDFRIIEKRHWRTVSRMGSEPHHQDP